MSHPPDTVDDEYAAECARLRRLADIGKWNVTVRFMPGDDVLTELGKLRVMTGLPPGWVELPPVDNWGPIPEPASDEEWDAVARAWADPAMTADDEDEAFALDFSVLEAP